MEERLMPDEPQDLQKWLKGIEWTLPTDGTGPPDMESEHPIEEEPKEEERKVFVQKVISEIWVYTDIDKKTFGQRAFQDIVILGEMSYDEAIKMIEDKKRRRRK
jgi:hypothetical protein